MRSFSTLEALKITGVSRSRIDQMISRGFLELRARPRPGKGREFGKNELAEIMVLDALIGLGIDIGSAEMMRHMPLRIGHYHVPEPMLLLVRCHNRLIQTSERGSSRERDDSKPTLRFGTTLSIQNSNRQNLVRILDNDDLISVAVIRLTEILAKAEAAEAMEELEK